LPRNYHSDEAKGGISSVDELGLVRCDQSVGNVDGEMWICSDFSGFIANCGAIVGLKVLKLDRLIIRYLIYYIKMVEAAGVEPGFYRFTEFPII